MWGAIVGALLCLGMTGTGWAQTPPATRAEALEAARAARELALAPESRDPIERAIFYVEDHRIIERLNPAQGFYPTMGSIVRGSGAGLGVGYRKRPFTDRLLFDVSTAITYRNYRSAQGAVHLQRIGGKPVELSVGGRWFDYTQDDYFGLGTTSLVSDRVSFAQQGTDLYSQVTARKAGWFVTRGRLGVRRYDVGPGTDGRFPSVEERFTEATAPGLTSRTSLGYAEASFGVDTRDEPGNTRGGGLYNVTFGAHRDRGATGFDFNRIDVKAMHVIPIFDKKRGIALHLAASRVDPVGDRLAPFFLMPTVGGADSLRGYREFRFRDRAALTMNGEYLWEATSALDLALFVDAADVGPSWKALVGARLKSSWGMGFRFNTNRRVFLRIDVARSHEGWRVWTALGPAFRVRPQ